MTENETNDWEDLLKCPGWDRLVKYAQQDYTAQINQLIEVAIKGDDATSLQRLRQVSAMKNAVQMLIEHPTQRLAALEHKPEPVNQYSRRGSL